MAKISFSLHLLLSPLPRRLYDSCDAMFTIWTLCLGNSSILTYYIVAPSLSVVSLMPCVHSADLKPKIRSSMAPYDLKFDAASVLSIYFILPCASCLHGLDKVFRVFHRNIRQNTVSEIKDMRRVFHRLQNSFHTRVDRIFAIKARRLHISLKDVSWTKFFFCKLDRRAPVDAKNVKIS